MLRRLYKKIIPERARKKIIIFSQKLIYPYYLGNQFYCNCCGKSFRRFLKKGNIPRDNAKCPYCSSLERTRILDLYLKNELNLYKKESLNILHVAPEDILFKKLHSLNNQYIDCDINLANARYQVDITDINFADNYFDIIICSHVLGHIKDESKAISEIYRVLQKDGFAIIMTLLDLENPHTIEYKHVTKAEDRLKFYGEKDLCRLHGLDFKKRIENQDFKVDQIDYRKELDPEIVKKNSLGDGRREIIFKCFK